MFRAGTMCGSSSASLRKAKGYQTASTKTQHMAGFGCRGSSQSAGLPPPRNLLRSGCGASQQQKPGSGLGCRFWLLSVKASEHSLAVIEPLAGLSRSKRTPQENRTKNNPEHGRVCSDENVNRFSSPPTEYDAQNKEENSDPARCSIADFSLATSADVSAPRHFIHAVWTGNVVISSHGIIPLKGL